MVDVVIIVRALITTSWLLQVFLCRTGQTDYMGWLPGFSLARWFSGKLSAVPYGNNPYSRVLNLIEEPIGFHNDFSEREVREFGD